MNHGGAVSRGSVVALAGFQPSLILFCCLPSIPYVPRWENSPDKCIFPTPSAYEALPPPLRLINASNSSITPEFKQKWLRAGQHHQAISGPVSSLTMPVRYIASYYGLLAQLRSSKLQSHVPALFRSTGASQSDISLPTDYL